MWKPFSKNAPGSTEGSSAKANPSVKSAKVHDVDAAVGKKWTTVAAESSGILGAAATLATLAGFARGAAETRPAEVTEDGSGNQAASDPSAAREPVATDDLSHRNTGPDLSGVEGAQPDGDGTSFDATFNLIAPVTQQRDAGPDVASQETDTAQTGSANGTSSAGPDQVLNAAPAAKPVETTEG